MSKLIVKSINLTSDQTAMAATTERSLRRLWMKSTRAEETDRMLGRLLSEGIWTNEIEANSWKAAGRRKWNKIAEL